MPRAAYDRRPKSASVFGEHIADKNLIFPNEGNITAAEILAFCPYWLKSADVVFRFCTNGMKQMITATMINHFRDLPGNPTTANSIYKMISNTMRDMERGHKWTTNDHERLIPEGWPAHRLDCRGFRTDFDEFPKRPRNRKGPFQVAFYDMMRGIKNLPEGNDALDLTRCVKYAASHPEERWLFPRDYTKLVEKLGGPQLVTQANWDEEVFKRWTARAGFVWIPVKAEQKQEPLEPRNSNLAEGGDVDIQDSDAGLTDELHGIPSPLQAPTLESTYIPVITPGRSLIVKLKLSKLLQHFIPAFPSEYGSGLVSTMSMEVNKRKNMNEKKRKYDESEAEEEKEVDQRKKKKSEREKIKEWSTQHADLMSPANLRRVRPRPRHLSTEIPKFMPDHLVASNIDCYKVMNKTTMESIWPNMNPVPDSQSTVEEWPIQTQAPTPAPSPPTPTLNQHHFYSDDSIDFSKGFDHPQYHIYPPTTQAHGSNSFSEALPPSANVDYAFYPDYNTSFEEQTSTYQDDYSASYNNSTSFAYPPYSFDGDRASSSYSALHHLTHLRADDTNESVGSVPWVNHEDKATEEAGHIAAIAKVCEESGWVSEAMERLLEGDEMGHAAI